jgi:ectoine hydroxylase-related dioxygenase (phytanoyl-CoA dioxygenase family)
MAECCDEPVVLFKDKINFKYPGGAGFTPHQDYPAYVNFGVEHHVTLMAPADPFTLENGCLVMALDACERRILPQNPDGTVRADVVAGLATTPLLAVPGDVIVFDAWVPHWSGRNESSAPRRSYYMTFNPAAAGDHRAAYYARKRECFPPEYERRPGVDYARLGAQFNLANPFD